jgi:hypothetical protein
MQRMHTFNLGRFSIHADIEPCSDLDLSFDENGEVASKLASGEYEAFNTRVSVWLNGVMIGSDWLCESIYANPVEFFSEHVGLAIKSRADGRNYGAYFPSMVKEAIAEARSWMASASIDRAA